MCSALIVTRTQGIIDKKAGQKVSAKQVDQGVQRRYSQDQLNFLDNLAFDSIDEEDFAPSPKLLKQADDMYGIFRDAVQIKNYVNFLVPPP